MSIITTYSYRRGVGKTTCIVNLAVLIAQQGYNVGVMSQHLLRLWDLMEIPDPDETEDVANIKAIAHFQVPIDSESSQTPIGKLVLLNDHPGLVVDVQRLAEEMDQIQQQFSLDYLFIELVDPQQSEMLSHFALCDVLILLLGLDHTDIQNTAVITDVAQQLGVDATFLLMSQTPPSLDSQLLNQQLQEICPTSQVAILPWVAEAALGVHEPLCLMNPESELTQQFRAIATKIMKLHPPKSFARSTPPKT